MVKILPNGEIVPDDDPRARNAQSRGNNRSERPRQGYVQHDNQEGMYEGGQRVSIFDTFNQKLLDLGIPRWNVGPYTVEPIVTVGFIAAGLLMGVQGLLLAAVLFAVCQWSSQGGAPNFAQWFGGGEQGGNNRGNQPGNSNRNNGGQRLGR